jgi:HSP20 family protein
MSTTLERRTPTTPTRFVDWFELPELFRFFDRGHPTDFVKIEQTTEKDHFTIKAEMPGIDPDKDVEITLADGVLTIAGERHEEEKTERAGQTVSEFRYGSFRRAVRVPREVKATDVKAAYKDGILTLTVPMPKEAKPVKTKVPVTRT